ncbi:hypothetical protein CAAN1_03S07602 [[Candida] anglica]|uniref:Uncharacterized protein n=1 Tax=[Candida] anglica TaxID=148631 RepID=A0ABP0EKY8_9ASCO
MNRTKSFSSPPDSEGIFERSLSTSMSSLPPQSRHKLARTMSNCSQHSASSYAVPTHHSTEDFIAPVLDSTTEILSNPSLDFSNVNIVCCCEDTDRDSMDEDAVSSTSGVQSLSAPVPGAPPLTSSSGVDEGDNTTGPCGHPKYRKSRSRSRSRSIICNSLMSSMSSPPTSQSVSTAHPHSHSHSHPHSHPHSSATGAGPRSPPSGPKSPSVRSNLSNASLSSHFHHGSPSLAPDAKTINFYSYADMLDKEKDSETGFSGDDLDSEPSSARPHHHHHHSPTFKGFSFAGAAGSHEVHSSAPPAVGTFSSSPPPPQTTSVDGFTTLSMKEYISKLT